jgi:hypothetical protein
MQKLYEELFDKTYRKALENDKRSTLVRRIVYACVVRQVILNESKPLPSYEELQAMPFFRDVSVAPTEANEIKSLLRFLRAIRTLMEMGFPGNCSKRNYLEVAGILDGTRRNYALGGAPSKATIRRIVIFHIVTGLPFSKKQPKKQACNRRGKSGRNNKRKITDDDDDESYLSEDILDRLILFAGND